MAKLKEEKTGISQPVQLWGTGTPKREFLYVEDLAEAVLYAVENKLEEHLYNVGTGEDLSIKDLAQKIQHITGHQGEIIWDSSKPDGTPRKLLDVSKLNQQGWTHKVDLDEGIEMTYNWFLENIKDIKQVKLD